jgi:hypothetical protein
MLQNKIFNITTKGYQKNYSLKVPMGQQISSKENFEDEKLDNPFINRLIKEVEYLKIDKDKIISTKDQQISSKDQQIEKLTNLLDQQQRLALQDKKLLEEYKEEIKELKSLMVPVRKDDKDPMVQKSKDIDNTKEELHTKIKNGGIWKECKMTKQTFDDLINQINLNYSYYPKL